MENKSILVRHHLAATAIAACAAPSLLAYNVSPSATFLNQALAFVLWGWFVIACAGLSTPRVAWRQRAEWPVLVALALLCAAALAPWWFGVLPSSLALSVLGTLVATVVLLVAGAQAARGEWGTVLFALFCLGWLCAGVLNAGISIVQVFAPEWPDGDWIAHSGIPGRAVGNLRQPNHLSSLLLWSCVAVAGLLELKRLQRVAAWVLMALMVFAVVLSASRTGLVSVLLLALWGLIDKRLSRATRLLLLASPLMYVLAWLGMSAWAELGAHRFGGAARLAETDVSGSRFGIWANTLALIRQQPLLGVGFGEFNYAWSLTPFPGRPIAFFDHAHNLPLQLAAEIGLPLATLVMALFLYALWRPAKAALHLAGDSGLALRCSLLMVVMIGLHSLLEYPLWYAYFLLPTAWAWGYALGACASSGVLSSSASTASSETTTSATAPRLMAALVMGGALAVVDYTRVSVIFSSAEGAAPLVQRIAAGQRSVLFSHHADYAAATLDEGDAEPAVGASLPTPPPTPPPPLAPFKGAAHYLLDTRLMMAWAKALAANGREDQASHLAARLKEFRNEQSDALFAACAKAPSPAAYPCHAPQRVYNWREFMP